MSPPTLLTEPFALRMARRAAGLLPRGRSALVRRTAHLLGYNEPFIAQVRDIRLVIDLTDRVSRTLYLFGDFERDVTQLLRALVQPGQIVFDVGANFGYFSLLAAGLVGSTGRVYAFEPDPRNGARLETNRSLNKVGNIQIVPLALFDRPGTVAMHMSSEVEDNLGSSSILAASPGRQAFEVAATTLDMYIAEQGLARVDMIKMDIEGAELAAIQGATESLRKKLIGGLLVELHRDILGPRKLMELVQRVQDFGYTAWFLHGRRPGARHVKEMVDPYLADRQFAEPNPHFFFTAQSW